MTAEKNIDLLKRKLLHWGNHQNNFCFLNSNKFSDDDKHQLCKYDFLAAAGWVDELVCENYYLKSLSAFLERNKGNWVFGFISYDLKNEIEKLDSGNQDGIRMPVVHFFIPETVFECKEGKLVIHHENKLKNIFTELESCNIFDLENCENDFELQPRISKEKYLLAVNRIKEHIQRGDVYELTFCQEFFSEDATINPAFVYEELNAISPAPMSCFYKLNDKFLISSSPERFLRKKGNKLFSQPIKGTLQRGNNKTEDEKLKQKLFNDEKERAENVMIVDLVRNDLSKVAERGSVQVNELFGIYSFNTMHQMISTVSCGLKDGIGFADIIKATFPMGSMTGAPKVKAMELIEKYESTKRGLFSGTAGYISPDGEFDFNVIIRSLLYNKTNSYLSLMVGSAITAKSNAEYEFKECLLKAEAIVHSLKNKSAPAQNLPG